MEYIVFILLAVVLFFSVLMAKKYPGQYKYILILPWVIELISFSLDYWGYKSFVKNNAMAFSRKLYIWSHFQSPGSINPGILSKDLSSFVDHVYSIFPTLDKERGRDVRTTTVAYLVIFSYKDIYNTVKVLMESPKNIDVKNITLLSIDIIGELVDRSDELGQEYFQHIIYGINKVLLLISKDGFSEANLKSIYATLYRVYKLTLAYNKIRLSNNLSREEFYEKINKVLNSYSCAFGWAK